MGAWLLPCHKALSTQTAAALIPLLAKPQQLDWRNTPVTPLSKVALISRHDMLQDGLKAASWGRELH